MVRWDDLSGDEVRVLATGRKAGILFLMDMPSGHTFTAMVCHDSVVLISDTDSLFSTYNPTRIAGGDITVSLPGGYALRGYKYIFLNFDY